MRFQKNRYATCIQQFLSLNVEQWIDARQKLWFCFAIYEALIGINLTRLDTVASLNKLRQLWTSTISAIFPCSINIIYYRIICKS